MRAQEKNSFRPRLPGVFFLSIGAYWLIIVGIQEGPQVLLGPGVASIGTSFLLLRPQLASLKTTRRVVAATGLYNLVILIYGAYAAFPLLSLGFGLVTGLVLAGHALAAAACVLMIVVVLTGTHVPPAVSGQSRVEKSRSRG